MSFIYLTSWTCPVYQSSTVCNGSHEAPKKRLALKGNLNFLRLKWITDESPEVPPEGGSFHQDTAATESVFILEPFLF